MRRVWLGAICVAVLGLWAAPAQAAFDDPLFFYTPQPTDSKPAPPAGYLDGPCGLAVSSGGSLYLSDYYHRAVDVFGVSATPSYDNQPLTSWAGGPNSHTGPLDDPCGLSFDSSGDLYVNDYHREVVRFPVPLSLATAQAIDTGDPSDPYANPTGVAADSTTDHAYVNDRTYVAEYDSTGSFVQRIGEGSLEGGYGIAVSRFPATAGYIYVPDAASDTVKVFDPSFSTMTPKSTIAGPPGGFGSLQDSAVAIDNSTGEVYVVDTLGPQLSEEPWAVVYVFAYNGTYEGRLKHAIVNAAPVGLAVDNSGASTQSRVYVTSGISENAGFYGYPAGAATSASAPPLAFGSSVSGGTGATPPSGGGSSLRSGSALDTVPGAATDSPAPGVALPGPSSKANAARRARKRRPAQLRRRALQDRRRYRRNRDGRQAASRR